MNNGNKGPSLTRFVYGGTFLICVMLLAAGWRTYSSAAIAGPRGQFGVNGPETLKYLGGLDFTIASTGDSNVVKQYTCAVNPSSCPAAGVRLMLIPEAAAAERDWESAMQPGRAGHVVAMVLNVDGATFSYLGLKPGERAYAWVGQIGPKTTDRGFAIYRVDASGVATNTWFVNMDRREPLRQLQCPKQAGDQDSASAGWTGLCQNQNRHSFVSCVTRYVRRNDRNHDWRYYWWFTVDQLQRRLLPGDRQLDGDGRLVFFALHHSLACASVHGLMSICASDFESSAALCGRASGFLARHERTSRSRSSGISIDPRIDGGAGS